MPKTNGYVQRQTVNGEFSPRINSEVNKLLDIYCKINGLNKTQYVNDLIARELEAKFRKLQEPMDN